ncbi:tetratricopeptide repeat protein 12 [Electrophorus electricus]|uniref:tetratricopeptide repeat protein 12 n=1 Tax=Electrophorus electricus TaxID=8005 RepID=UPI0015CFCF54|nr:tetratricopeptide repeat protein 12 [Electrophorus electricus]
MEPCENDDLESFLQKVDQISELVKGLNCSDAAVQEKAAVEAERFVDGLFEQKPCRRTASRTVLTTTPPSVQNAPHQPNQSAEDFMSILEKDAEERRKRRQVKEKLANALKEKGNKAFALGDYEVAVRMYTEGLEQLRDMQALYTNRAQAFIKLQKYKEAISDCEWALKCSEKCVKAYVHMGRAHLALKNFTESRFCYQKILDVEPERETLVKEYLTQVDLEEKKTLQEKAVREELEEGRDEAMVVPDLLKKLNKPNELDLYYCGGVELLLQAVKEGTGQTSFRLNNGFSIISGNNSVRRCLTQTSEEPYSEELCAAVLRLWRAVCSGNEENQELLMQCPSTREQIVRLLGSRVAAIQRECLTLLLTFSHTQHGRRLVIKNLSVTRMVETLMDCVCADVTSGTTALAVLANLAGDNKFQIQCRDNFTLYFAPVLEQLLGDISASSQELLPSFISVTGAMCLDQVINSKMANRAEFWESSFTALGRHASCEQTSVLYPLLGLMINIAAVPNLCIQEHAVEGCRRCVTLLSNPDGGIITRAAGLLSAALPTSPAATREAVQHGVVKRMLKILKEAGQMSSRYSIKALAVCTTSSQQACEELVVLDKRLKTLRKLLDSSDEVVVGNAALCLGHCLAVPEAGAALLGTDCVQLLLRHSAGQAGHAGHAAVQKNAAVALGKLCKAEPRHLVKLRELHGLEILHACMKLIS